MSYERKTGHLVPSGAVAAAALTTTGVLTPAYAVHSPCRINRIGCLVTTTISGGAASVQFIYRPTYGSASSQTVLGTVTIPDSSAAGTYFYKNLGAGTELKPGGQLVYNVSVASANAGGASMGQEIDDSPEEAGNCSSMTASA